MTTCTLTKNYLCRYEAEAVAEKPLYNSIPQNDFHVEVPFAF